MRSILTVTSPAGDLSLLTLEELREATGVEIGEDVRLIRLGKRISAAIARACGVAGDGANTPTLRRETCSEVFRPTVVSERLRLARRPVSTITSVVENAETLTTSDYEVEPSTGFLYRLSNDERICWPARKIAVAYVAGFETVPDDLRLAAMKLAGTINAETARDPNLKRENVPGTGEFEYWVAPADDPLMAEEIQELLEPYRQYWI